MNYWWAIFFAGIGTYLMRSAGAWVSPRWLKADWIGHLPFAVILVMAVSSIASFTNLAAGWMPLVGAIAASLAVVFAALRRLPLGVCIVIGCALFGAFNPD